MAVSKKLRFEIFRRDGFACRYCGKAAKVATNLVTACEDCNSGKSDTPLDAPCVRDVSPIAFRIACLELDAPDPQDSEEFEDFNMEGAVAWTRNWTPTFIHHGGFNVAFALAVASGYSREEIIAACVAAGDQQDPNICLYLPKRERSEEPEEAAAYDDAVAALARFIPWERREFIWRARAAAGGYQPTPRQLVRAAGLIAREYAEEEGRDYGDLARWLSYLPDGEGSKHLVAATAEWDAVWQGRAGHSAHECHDEVLQIAVSRALGAEVPA